MEILRHYTGVMRRWLCIILIITAICSITTFSISTYLIKPTYQATSLIQVNGPLTSSGTSANSDVFRNQALAVGYSLLITSTDVLRVVAQKVPGVNLSQLQSTVSASPKAGSQIIEVQALANSPQRAADIANTVVSVFIQWQVGKALAPLTGQDTKISQDLLTTKAAISQAQTQLTTLQKSGASTDAIAAENSILATYQANYNSLITNQHQIQTQENQIKNALSVDQTAIPPSQISSPHILLNTITAGALGLLLTIVLALLLDWLDVSIQTPEDVTNLAQLEPLGSVPLSTHPLLLTNGAKSSDTNLRTKNESSSVGAAACPCPVSSRIGEQGRDKPLPLRRRLKISPLNASWYEIRDETIEQAFTVMTISTNFSMLNKDQHLVVVTGLRTAAGVTTTATNLAIVLARLGRRVLLVDTNLHRGSLHEIFHCSNTTGLVNSLEDVHQFKSETIPSWLDTWRTQFPNLWLLPTGSATASSPLAERLPEMRVLIHHLLETTQNTPDATSSKAVDIIIFDAPALGQGADAIALASLTDCSILVVEAGKERHEMVSKAGSTLQRLGSPVLGVVVNRQTTRHRPYFYTGERSQKTALTDNLPLEEEALLKQLTALPDTPLSQPQANQQHELAGQAQPPTYGDIDKHPTETLPPSSYTPWPQDLQEATTPRIPGLKSYSSENTK